MAFVQFSVYTGADCSAVDRLRIIDSAHNGGILRDIGGEGVASAESPAASTATGPPLSRSGEGGQARCADPCAPGRGGRTQPLGALAIRTRPALSPRYPG